MQHQVPTLPISKHAVPVTPRVSGTAHQSSCARDTQYPAPPIIKHAVSVALRVCGNTPENGCACGTQLLAPSTSKRAVHVTPRVSNTTHPQECTRKSLPTSELGQHIAHDAEQLEYLWWKTFAKQRHANCNFASLDDLHHPT